MQIGPCRYTHLSHFMFACADAIVNEWQAVASPSAAHSKLRDEERHEACKAVVIAISANMQRVEMARPCLSDRSFREASLSPGAAVRHGALAQHRGVSSAQIVREFGALRSVVLKRWLLFVSHIDGSALLEQTLRLDQAIDSAMSDSIESFVAALTSSRDAYLFSLGQDLRLPLKVIQTASTVLGRPDFGPDTRQTASRRVRGALTRMDSLMSDVMEYTRNRGAVGIPLERAPGNLQVACEQSVERARTTHPERNFETGFSGDLAAIVDQPRIQQALSNLLHNAAVHGDGAAPIRLTAMETQTSVALSVWNSGTLIPAREMQALFEPRMRERKSRSQEVASSTPGLGLGLFIVREIARGHGGEVDAVSTDGGGTRFTIHLPRSWDTDQPSRPTELAALNRTGEEERLDLDSLWHAQS